MAKKTLCGSSCVKYILKYYKKNFNNINLHMNWVPELAICLHERKINNLEILCYKSNLYLDFVNKKNLELNFDGFKYIKKSIDLNIKITEKKLDVEELLKELNLSEFIILCVESSVFNGESMSGGHFIILNKIENGKIKVINPIKETFEYKLESFENIIKYCQNYGSWRILIKEDNR